MDSQARCGTWRSLRAGLTLLPLLAASCAGLDRNDQGQLQPQSVRGPCQVKKFFLLGLRSVPTNMTVGNVGAACTFTVLNPDLQVVINAALVTGPASHGQAAVGLNYGNRQAVVYYTPQPGYIGTDRFSVTLEPNAIGITVNVTVQQAPPPGSQP